MAETRSCAADVDKVQVLTFASTKMTFTDSVNEIFMVINRLWN